MDVWTLLPVIAVTAVVTVVLCLLAINFAAEEQNLDLSTLPNLAENIRYHRYSWSCAGPCIRSGSIYSDPYSNHWFVMKIQCDGFEALQGSILT